MKTYVGNLPAGTADAGLADIFESFGIVTSAYVPPSRGSGHSRGFGFVEILRESAERSISRLRGKLLCGLELRVKEPKAGL